MRENLLREIETLDDKYNNLIYALYLEQSNGEYQNS